jgi:hypothetical protein
MKFTSPSPVSAPIHVPLGPDLPIAQEVRLHETTKLLSNLRDSEETPHSAVNLSSRPERTRISYLAALTTTTYAALRKERRTKFINATGLNRKSGGAQWRDLQFLFLVF